MFSIPDFSKDIADFKDELTAIRRLLEQLVEIQEEQ
jgi:hypothetical protein